MPANATIRFPAQPRARPGHPAGKRPAAPYPRTPKTATSPAFVSPHNPSVQANRFPAQPRAQFVSPHNPRTPIVFPHNPQRESFFPRNPPGTSLPWCGKTRPPALFPIQPDLLRTNPVVFSWKNRVTIRSQTSPARLIVSLPTPPSSATTLHSLTLPPSHKANRPRVPS